MASKKKTSKRGARTRGKSPARDTSSAESTPPIPNVNEADPAHVDLEERDEREKDARYYVVGIGASAGGLEAASALLRALPPDAGMAFVLVQHLDPKHPSLLPEILGRTTSMPVRTVEDGMPVEPNHVYVIPPNRDMGISRGTLRLAPRSETRGVHRPIDHFLRSLAEEQGHKTIGVILSGTSNDGTLGLVELKAAGGITFAQDGTAEQSSMPRNAVATGSVDFVLPPDEIAREIGRISRHPLVAAAHETEIDEGPRRDPLVARILDQVRSATNVDFTHYKRNTLHRRITRRMVLHKLGNLEEYQHFLGTNASEVDALYQDILINVTSFFRNPDSYEALKTAVFPQLCADRSRNEPVRMWTLGCSTGEEAYSLAMAFSEYTESAGRRVALQVFATDLNGAGIEKARAGVYPRGITQDLSADRLRRFFVEVDGGYRISKSIRDMCVFARQNVLADPPFSRMDLIACRNVLIYLETTLQQRLIPILHYALRNVGYLWLGSSETIGSYRDLFALESPKHKIYAKKASDRQLLAVPASPGTPQFARYKAAQSDPVRDIALPGLDPQREADRLVLARYAPAGVLIDHNLDIVQFRGDTTPYLVPAPGRASLNLLKMLRDGLLIGVRGAVHRARREDLTVREEGLRVRVGGVSREVDVVAVPMKAGASGASMLVLFEEPSHGAEARSRELGGMRARAESAESEVAARDAMPRDKDLERTQQELAATRDYLQSVIEQQEAANEELQSANEEVQSSNEELQSINEELETSKEEIQSSNEELATVNDELQNRNLELTQINDDLSNLLASVQMAIVMLGQDLRVRRYTPAAEKLLSLIPGDVGRPIADIKLNFTGAGDLERLLVEAIDSVSSQEREVQDKNGHWYLLRVRPYRTAENRIEGAVLMLIDTDSLKRSQGELRESEARFETLADTAPVLIWVNDLEGCRFVNRAFELFAGLDEADLEGLGWTQVLHPGDRGEFMSAYLAALERRGTFEYQCRFRRADGEFRWMKTVATPRFLVTGEFVGYVGCSLDITEMKHAEAAWLEMDRRKNEFLATLAHELRNPLAAVKNASYLLTRVGSNPEAVSRAGEVIERQTHNMVRLVDDLLDVSRLTHGKIQLQAAAVSLNDVLLQALTANEEERASARQELEVVLAEPPVWVRADATRLDQVFTNLLDNASKFTPTGGHIWVSMEVEGSGPDARVAVRVRDDGVGIDPAMVGRIFDLFVQGERQAPSAQIGMGLGLTLAKRLVEWHGGTIEARSAGRGQGSEFVVRLPILAPHEVPDSPAAAPEPAPRRAGRDGHRVLVVDDNVDAGETLRALLESQGKEVLLARDGAEALRVAESQRPDVVLLDIGMPDMDGYAVARCLREQPATRDVTIVAITGYGRREDVEKCRAAGIDKHMTKPVRLDALLELIAGAPLVG